MVELYKSELIPNLFSWKFTFIILVNVLALFIRNTVCYVIHMVKFLSINHCIIVAQEKLKKKQLNLGSNDWRLGETGNICGGSFRNLELMGHMR